MKYFNSLSYLVGIILVNCLFAYLPTYSIAGAVFSSGDILVGIIYILRDFSQREIGKNVLYVMLLGCLFSYLFADKQVSVASISSFFVGETIEWAIFTFTRKPLSQRLLLSSMLSVPADSIIFLYMLNQLNIIGFVVLTSAKILGISALWAYWRKKQVKPTLLEIQGATHEII
jgi:uncharacterized PurR-regulated membrane protein YhhQ (DUF165 family)